MNIGFKGTSIDQDVRFSDKEKRELKKMKFPAEFNEKVDFSKIKIDVIAAWVTKRVTEILGFEDDVVINMVTSYLQSKEVDPKKMQLNLTGFLEKDTAAFVTDLWRLLLDAQQNNGVPSVMMDEIKAELRKRKEESSRIEKGIEMSQQRSVKAEDTRVKREQDNNDDRRERHGHRGRSDRDRDSDRRRDRSRDRSRERERDSERRRRERERRRSRSRSRSRSKERRHKRKRSRSSSSESRSDERKKRSRADEHSRKDDKEKSSSVPADSILETKLREEALKSMKK